MVKEIPTDNAALPLPHSYIDTQKRSAYSPKIKISLSNNQEAFGE